MNEFIVIIIMLFFKKQLKQTNRGPGRGRLFRIIVLQISSDRYPLLLVIRRRILIFTR